MRRILDALTSRRLSHYVLAAWALLTVVWVLPFQFAGLTEDAVTQIASGWWVFRIVYVLVLLTTAACVISRAERDIRRARRWGDREPAPRKHATVSETSLDDLDSSLASVGFSVARFDNGLRAVRHRWAPLGGTLFHLAVLVVAAGLLVHAQTFESASLQLVEGEEMPTVGTAPDGGISPELARSAEGLTLRSITPEFHEDVLLFSRLEAEMIAADGSSRALTLSDPLWLDPITYLTIEDFGYAPSFVMIDPSGAIVDGVYRPLSVFPPGTEDSVVFPDAFLDVAVVLYPDHGVREGRDVSLSYNLAEPRLLLSLSDSSREFELKERRLVAVGEPIEVRTLVGTRTVTADGIGRYGVFRVTRSAGLPVLVLGGLLAVVGLAWRVLYRRLDVVAWTGEDGRTRFDAWLDAEGRRSGREAVERILERAVRTVETTDDPGAADGGDTT
jgi:hypothetical protein